LFSKKKCFVNGSRFLVNEGATNQFLSKTSITVGDLKIFSGKNNLNKIRSKLLMNLFADRYQSSSKNAGRVRGCNMSFWKEDLIAINGYNELFQGWGREDSDLAIRLANNGIRKRFLKFGGIAYHLNHPLGDKKDDEKYLKMVEESIDRKLTWTTFGIDQHKI
jgi:N-terminal domain of galactosyltransferase